MDSNLKIFGVAIVGIILFGLLLVLIFKLYKKFFTGVSETAMILGKIDTSVYTVIPSIEVMKPLDGFNYSLVFSINISNFYHNYGYWRHIFHIGTSINEDKVLQYPSGGQDDLNWSVVEADFPQQNPGFWLHPVKNTIRMVLTTEQNEFTKYPEHAQPDTVFDEPETEVRSYNSNIINTIDLTNIPINRDVSLGFIFQGNSVRYFIDGVLRSVFTFNGKPFGNNGAMYIHRNKTYTGKINSLKLYPKPIPEKKIE